MHVASDLTCVYSSAAHVRRLRMFSSSYIAGCRTFMPAARAPALMDAASTAPALPAIAATSSDERAVQAPWAYLYGGKSK